jgi:predicted permease
MFFGYRKDPKGQPNMIVVPLISVLYCLALFSFAIAAYYGLRLIRMTHRARVMLMITQDGPTTIVYGLVLLAASQIPNLVAASIGEESIASDVLAVPVGVLLVGSAVMFAWGIHRMYSVFLNEKLKMSVKTELEDLLDKEKIIQKEEFKESLR